VIYRGCVGQQPYNYASIVVQNIKKYLAGKSILPTILEPVPAYVSGQTIPQVYSAEMTGDTYGQPPPPLLDAETRVEGSACAALISGMGIHLP